MALSGNKVTLRYQNVTTATETRMALESRESSEKALPAYNVSEYITSIGKVLLGATPLAGPALAEMIGVIVPGQRFDRLVRYAVRLEEKIGHLDAFFLKAQLADQNFTDLMEEGIIQAARSVTDQPQRVQRGGSFLCTDHYCTRYMMGTRGKGDVDTGNNNVGFRCVETK